MKLTLFSLSSKRGAYPRFGQCALQNAAFQRRFTKSCFSSSQLQKRQQMLRFECYSIWFLWVSDFWAWFWVICLGLGFGYFIRLMGLVIWAFQFKGFIGPTYLGFVFNWVSCIHFFSKCSVYRVAGSVPSGKGELVSRNIRNPIKQKQACKLDGTFLPKKKIRWNIIQTFPIIIRRWNICSSNILYSIRIMKTQIFGNLKMQNQSRRYREESETEHLAGFRAWWVGCCMFWEIDVYWVTNSKCHTTNPPRPQWLTCSKRWSWKGWRS